MNTSQSFSGYKSRLGGLGEFSDNTKRLIVVGYLGSDFFITERLMGQDFGRCYNHASNIAGSIESILKESFGPLEVIGTQTPSKKDNTQGNFYSAFFHSSDDAGLVYSVLLDYGIPRRQMHPRFSASFPLGDYESNTQSALAGIWPDVQNIEFRKRSMDSADFHDGYILLTEGGKIIASGHPALGKFGHKLEEKELRHKDPNGYKLGPC